MASQSSSYSAWIWISASMAILITAGRFWIRISMRNDGPGRSPRAEDYLNLAALVFLLIESGAFQAFTNSRSPESLLLWFLFWLFSQYTAKACILALYYSFYIYYTYTSRLIFGEPRYPLPQPITSRSYLYAMWAVAAVIVACFVVTILGPRLMCASLPNCGLLFTGKGVMSTSRILAFWFAASAFSNICLMLLSTMLRRPSYSQGGATVVLAATFALTVIHIAVDAVRLILSHFAVGEKAFYVITLLEPPLAVIICALPAYRFASASGPANGRIYPPEYRKKADGEGQETGEPLPPA